MAALVTGAIGIAATLLAMAYTALQIRERLWPRPVPPHPLDRRLAAIADAIHMLAIRGDHTE